MNEISTWVRRPGKIPAPLLRRSGLTETDIARAQRALATLGGGWVLDRHEDYERVVSLVITAIDEHDDTPTFALHLEQGAIRAGLVLHDHYISLGRHARVEDAIRAMGAVLRGERPLAA
ncbi:MAG: hypothetical protein P4L71_11900 [Acetobacteraceae bacterium]|nr:hypothetical protein [Acetobacteraceae bacterium]